MSAITPIASSLLAQPGGTVTPPVVRGLDPGPAEGARLAQAGNTEGFGHMLDGLVSSVDAKQAQAADLTRQVLLGNSDQLHQSVIAMQEASVALSLMVQVRNKLVDSYQELMRMQV